MLWWSVGSTAGESQAEDPCNKIAVAREDCSSSLGTSSFFPQYLRACLFKPSDQVKCLEGTITGRSGWGLGILEVSTLCMQG